MGEAGCGIPKTRCPAAVEGLRAREGGPEPEGRVGWAPCPAGGASKLG